MEQSYKQTKGALGWADFQVRSDRAIRCHSQLVCGAFSFCWCAWFEQQEPHDQSIIAGSESRPELTQPGGSSSHPFRSVLAPCPPTGPELVGSLDLPLALVARLFRSAPAS